MRRRDFRDQRAEHDELATLSDRDHDRHPGQDDGSGERRVRERCEQDREQADCEYGAGGEQSVSAAHPRHHPCRRYLRYDDEESVEEDDDTDPNGPDGCMRLRKRREDVGEERAADHHKRAVDAARCSAGTRVKVRTWPAVPTNPKPAPPTAEQTKPCQGRSTNAKPP